MFFSVLLQSCAQRGERSDAQEPASLHHYEPHRSQPGAAHPGGKINRLILDEEIRSLILDEESNWIILG
jgi:hypothetical protein